MKVLVTSASFHEVPGRHRELLDSQGYELDFIKGPLGETILLPIIAGYDAMLCGDDEISAAVLQAGAAGSLKYISKYGIGVDKIDLGEAKHLGIPVTICPGVNQFAVAELVFALLLACARNIHREYNITRAGGWQKLTGFELYGKTLGIAGFGAIGKEVALRAKAFGMQVVVYTAHPDIDVLAGLGYGYAETLPALAQKCDVLTLHIPLTAQTRGVINTGLINGFLKKGAIIINTARGGLVDNAAIEQGLSNGVISAYLADVLDIEPPPANHILTANNNTLITPHIGSRTWQSVERQGVLAAANLINMVNGDKEAYRANMAK